MSNTQTAFCRSLNSPPVLPVSPVVQQSISAPRHPAKNNLTGVLREGASAHVGVQEKANTDVIAAEVVVERRVDCGCQRKAWPGDAREAGGMLAVVERPVAERGLAVVVGQN